MATFVTDISASAFEPLLEELIRDQIPVNHDRATAGKGRSQAFGIIRRWSYRPHLARNTWMRPRLWQLLLDFASVHVPITWDGVTVNDTYQSAPHRDKGNEGQSFTVTFGDFTGGDLCIGTKTYNTRHRGLLFNGCSDLHWTAAFEGRRFCLVFYTIVWPTKFLPRYKVTCHKEPDGLQIEDEYDESVVVLDRKGHVMRIITPAQPREWIGRLTSRGQKSRAVLTTVEPDVPDA